MISVPLEEYPGKRWVERDAYLRPDYTGNREGDEAEKYSQVVHGHYKLQEVLEFIKDRKTVHLPNQPDSQPDDHSYGNSVYEGNANWKGGTYEDIFEISDSRFEDYKEMEKELRRNKLWDHIKKTFGEGEARKRVRNEYDGEWDYDKRYDLNPFTKREMRPSIVRIVKIYADLSFSCGVGSEAINKYGAFVVSVVKYLESQGVLVELYGTHSGKKITGGSDVICEQQVYTIKRSNEYIPTKSLLQVFSSVFMRRLMHANIIVSAEMVGRRVDGGLGSPFQYGKPWEKTNDAVYIYSCPDHQQQKDIVSALGKLLGVNPGKKKKAKKKSKKSPHINPFSGGIMPDIDDW